MMNEIFQYLLKNLSKNSEKYVSHWEKLNFEHIEISVHTAEFLTLEKTLNILWTIRWFTQAENIWNESTSSIQAYIQQWFHDEEGAKF